MTLEEAQRIIRRIDAAWPGKTSPTTEHYGEWVDFLDRYEYKFAELAVDDLRADFRWRPTMADFRKAYFAASTAAERPRLALPGKTDGQTTLRDLYGQDESEWVYCCRCDLAITLEERARDPIEWPGRGLQHAHCPHPGTAPRMPADQRAERAEKMSKRSD